MNLSAKHYIYITVGGVHRAETEFTPLPATMETLLLSPRQTFLPWPPTATKAVFRLLRANDLGVQCFLPLGRNQLGPRQHISDPCGPVRATCPSARHIITPRWIGIV